MGIELIVITVALLMVVIMRGSLRAALTSFSYTWVLGLAVAGHLVIEFVPFEESQYDTIGLGILLFTYVMLFGFCCANLNLRGMWIVLTGTALNAFVIGLNKGMPVTTSGDFTVEESIKHQAQTSSDILPWLGDVIPVDALSMAISVGDIIFAVGVMVVLISASRVEKSHEVDVTVDELNDDIEEVTMEEVMTEAALSKKALSFSGVLDNDEYIDIREDEMEVVAPPAPAPARVMDISQDKKDALVGPAPAPEMNESKPRMKAKSHKHASRRSRKRWQKTHGLNALPSKEELGFDETSMTIVESAE